jgi:hypothetical protein
LDWWRSWRRATLARFLFGVHQMRRLFSARNRIEQVGLAHPRSSALRQGDPKLATVARDAIAVLIDP